MPSPGQVKILNDISGFEYEAAPGVSTTLKAESKFIQKLAIGLHNGWTSASPTTTTTAEAQISAAFQGFALAPQSLLVLKAMGIGIDSETATWAASYNATTVKHVYQPKAASIKAKILAACPVQYPAVKELANAVANMFVKYFEQEVG